MKSAGFPTRSGNRQACSLGGRGLDVPVVCEHLGDHAHLARDELVAWQSQGRAKGDLPCLLKHQYGHLHLEH